MFASKSLPKAQFNEQIYLKVYAQKLPRYLRYKLPRNVHSRGRATPEIADLLHALERSFTLFRFYL